MQNMNIPAYVFATVNPVHAKKVVEELNKNENIDLVAPVTGRFDLALRIKQTNPEQIYQIVKWIRQVPGVQSTQTLFGFNGFQNGMTIQSRMPLGISLFNVTSPVETVISQLKSFPGLVEAWTVPGQFDIVALWQAKTADEIAKATFEKFPTLQGIAKSETLLAYAPIFKA
ncbi:MAG TPA: Lrp/AsnC ligand binding domain-containing protein [Candidatus Bathyarchaeia archaeon]